MAWTFSGFASIPLWETMKPKNLPDLPKNTLTRVQLHLVLFEVGERLLKVIQVCKLLFALDEHIIDVDLHVFAYLFVEHLVHQSLIRSPCVL